MSHLGHTASLGIRAVLASALLFAVIVLDVLLGGSTRGAPLTVAALEVTACLVLIWCLFDGQLRQLSGSALWLLTITLIASIVCLVQLVPLPYAWWTQLPGREPVAQAFKTLGIGEVSQTLSLQPDRTLEGFLRFLPPIAVFVLAAKLPWRMLTAFLPWTIVGLAILGALLGLAQMLAPGVTFLFSYGSGSTRGGAGLFEVINHQATLQLMAIPFVAVLFGKLRTQFELGDAFQAQLVLVVAAVMLLGMAVVLSGSFAGYVMILPVIMLSSLGAIGGKPTLKAILAIAAVGAGLAVLGYLTFTSPLVRDLGLGNTDLGDNPLSRVRIYRDSIEMVRDYFPWGAGLGSFENAYPAYEDPITVAAGYIIHAHNEYLEIAAELGLAGCIILAAIIAWFAAMTVRAWRSGRERGGHFKKAASISVGVVLAHSLVDFPARTEAISCLAAVCMAMMASGPRWGDDRSQSASSRSEFRHKHLEI